MAYAELGKHTLAEKNIEAAIAVLEKSQDYYPISVYLTYMADIYSEKKNFQRAYRYAERSLKLANQYRLKDQISNSNLKLSELHEQAGEYQMAHKFYKEYIIYRDSVKNIANVQLIAD